MSDAILQVSNLEKHFRVGRGKILRAVDNVSFAIQRGKTLGLVGESGCGKTTVGRTLLRIYEPDGGTIVFDGQDISKVTRAQAKALTRKMQMIFQDPYARTRAPSRPPRRSSRRAWSCISFAPMPRSGGSGCMSC